MDGRDALDQKVKSDAGKPKLSLVPRQIIFDVARIREYGNAKYPDGGVDNWKNVEPERYKDAAFRHFLAYLDDPHGMDKESGLPHLWHLACNIAFLCELEHKDIVKSEDVDHKSNGLINMLLGDGFDNFDYWDKEVREFQGDSKQWGPWGTEFEVKTDIDCKYARTSLFTLKSIKCTDGKTSLGPVYQYGDKIGDEILAKPDYMPIDIWKWYRKVANLKWSLGE